jgi:hypothetical protein
MAEATRDFLRAWEGLRTEAEEVRELDPERVLVLDRPSGGRGKTSGLDVAQISSPARLVIHLDCQHALADLGLSEADARRS